MYEVNFKVNFHFHISYIIYIIYYIFFCGILHKLSAMATETKPCLPPVSSIPYEVVPVSGNWSSSDNCDKKLHSRNLKQSPFIVDNKVQKKRKSF